MTKQRKAPEQSADSPACELVVCEDPTTGEIIVRPRGNCPRGFVERIRDKTSEHGLTFIVPKVRTKEE